jgi:putative transposase
MLDDFATYYAGLGMSHHHIQEIEDMRKSAPVRVVGHRALSAFRVEFSSRINSATRKLESRSCEFLHALELELDPDVLAYWCQVPIRNVQRGIHISAVTADFMVFRRRGIELIECKPEESIRKLSANRPEEWIQSDLGWIRPHVSNALNASTCATYRVWCPPDPYPIYLANLELLYDKLRPIADQEQRRLQTLRKSLASQPLSIAHAQSLIVGLTLESILAFLAAREVHGLVRSRSLDQLDDFILYATRQQAEHIDFVSLGELRSGRTINSWSGLLSASTRDYERGLQRLHRVRRMQAGHEPVTRGYAALVRAVEKSERDGTSPLAACLTAYSNCGRRGDRLTTAQRGELNRAVSQYCTARDPARTQLQSYARMRDRCLELGIRSPSRTTLSKEIKKISCETRAYRTGGHRAFHAARRATEPYHRSLSAIAFGTTVHVDSSKFDTRCLVPVGLSEEQLCPTLYVAVDQSSGIPLGRSLVFGSSCRDALAILVRDVLSRQRFLPRYWFADGGSEYTSHWFSEFCLAYGLTRLQPPAGGARFNSLAENTIGRTSSQLARFLKGSTFPDRQGRRVDGRFKSYKNAKHVFRTLVTLVDDLLFGDFARTPHNPLLPGSPQERMEESLDVFGESGVHTPYDDTFLFLTSIPIKNRIKVDPVRGIRYEGRTYSGDRLLHLITQEKASQYRRDCADPSVMYVKFKHECVKAQSQDYLRIQSAHPADRLFTTSVRALVAAENRALSLESTICRNRKIDLANASADATRHVAPTCEDANSSAPTHNITDWLGGSS